MWPRNVRVGANSPSLWPTIASVTNTGTCLRPSCTAMVWPSMAGTIIDRRDQVLMTFLVPLSFWTSTFFMRWSSTKGPFFRERGIAPGLRSALLAGLAAADDQGVARLVLATGAALGLATRVDRVAATRGLALTTAVWVVDGVHRHTAHGRALALPAHAAGLAPVDVRLLGVADLADRRAAAHVDEAHLARGHAQRRARALARHELRAHAGRAGDLGPATGTQLDRVDRGADRDVAQRQVVAGLDVGVGARLDHGALTEVLGGDDVALLAVGVVQQRDAGGAVGVVLDVRDLGRDAVLVVAPEVDDAVGALVTAALVPGGDAAVHVASTLAVQGTDERLLRLGPRDLDEVGDAGTTTAGRRRLVFADTHQTDPPKRSMRSPAARLTIALLVSLRLPKPSRVRLRLPCRLIVLTLETLTLKTFSTAILISV